MRGALTFPIGCIGSGITSPKGDPLGQAMARIWRQGQTKPCFIYRFVLAGTLEDVFLGVICWKFGENPCAHGNQMNPIWLLKNGCIFRNLQEQICCYFSYQNEVVFFARNQFSEPSFCGAIVWRNVVKGPEHVRYRWIRAACARVHSVSLSTTDEFIFE